MRLLRQTAPRNDEKKSLLGQTNSVGRNRYEKFCAASTAVSVPRFVGCKIGVSHLIEKQSAFPKKQTGQVGEARSIQKPVLVAPLILKSVRGQRCILVRDKFKAAAAPSSSVQFTTILFSSVYSCDRDWSVFKTRVLLSSWLIISRGKISLWWHVRWPERRARVW